MKITAIPMVLSIVLIVVSLLPLAIEVYYKKFNIFNLKNPFILYFTLQIGVTGLITMYSGSASYLGLDPNEFYQVYIKVYLVSISGIVMYHFGYYFTPSIIIRAPIITWDNWIINRVYISAFILMIASYLMLYILIKVNGGYDEFVMNREAWRTAGVSGQGILVFPIATFSFLATLTVLITYYKRITNVNHLKYIILIMVSLSILPGIILGFRKMIVLPLIQMLLIKDALDNKLSFKKLSIYMILIAIIFTAYGAYRNNIFNTDYSSNYPIDIIKNNGDLLLNLVTRSRGAEHIAVVINDIDSGGKYDYGFLSLLEALTIHIPRTVWEEKITPSSVRFTTRFFSDKLEEERNVIRETWSGVSPTIVGELYWHLGWLGVLFGLFMMGVLAKILYGTLMHRKTDSGVLIYSYIYVMYAMMAENLQGYVNSFVLLIPFLIIYIVTVRVKIK